MTRFGRRAAHGRAVVVVLAATVLPLATVGCSTQSGTGGEAAGEPPLGDVPHVTAASQLVLPLDQFEGSTVDHTLDHQASQILAARCAARFGVTSTDRSMSDVAPGGPNTGRYGIVEREIAARFGYHSAEQGGDDAKTNSKYGPDAWNPSPEELVVLDGTKADGSPLARDELPRDANGEPLPEGGCSRWANLELTGGAPIPFSLIDQWGGEASQAAEADSRVRAANDGWSRCMKARGYDYKSIWDPNDSFSMEPTSTAKEIATAVADVECRQETNLVGIWMAVETAYQHRVISANEGQFHEVQSIMKRWSDAARRVVAESGRG